MPSAPIMFERYILKKIPMLLKISAVKVTLVVTYDGKECTAASIESKKLTFTCEGKTYEASFVNDVLTITEKA